MENHSLFPAILGVGNALVDIMVALPGDETLHQFGLRRGSMTLVDAKLSWKIYQATHAWQKSVTTGGSAANTIHTLASLGARCGYAGKIGDDELGENFAKEFTGKGITTHLSLSDSGTGRVMALVSPDSERTMATCLGAAEELLPEEFTAGMMNPYSYLYVEGYLVQDHRLIESILRTGQEAGLEVVIDLSSYNVVEQNRDFLEHLITHYVDIVFANEEEAYAFTGLQPEEAVKRIASLCDIAIVKTGKNGSLVAGGDEMLAIDPVQAHAIDTTGAGDSYSAGFLFGLSRGLTLRQCGDIASLVAAKTVEFMGAKIAGEEWPGLLRKVEEICGTSVKR